jgi:hypothetical protein
MACAQAIENIGVLNKITDKLLGKNEKIFLTRLIFWSRHKNCYGISKEGRVWIWDCCDLV